MFIEVPTGNEEYEFVSVSHITKVFSHKSVTRINLMDGNYTITTLEKEEVMELINEIA